MTEDKSMGEIVTEPLAKGLTGIILDIAKKVGGSVYKHIKDKKQAAEAAKKYADKYSKRYG
jgi:hypothetical protein